jgi:outer membrane receptor protein involved in Fe transport
VAALCAGTCLGWQASVAAADPAAQPGTQVEEIIVTAQKRSENVEKVPASILVAGGGEIRQRQIETNDQLMKVVPDLRVYSATGGVAQDITIRGVGPSNNYNTNVLQPVGLYMDEIYQTFLTAPGTQLFDLERIEVLKGPQGTLYGRNTTGGAVNYISQKPGLSTSNYNGYLEGGYGNYNHFEIQGASDFTLIENVLGARLAFSDTDRDGYIQNVGVGGPKTFGSAHIIDGRFLLKYAPDNHFSALFAVYVNHYDGSIPAGIFYGVYPNDTAAGGYSRQGLTNYQAALNFYRPDHTESNDFALTLNWVDGPLKLTSISSYERSSGSNNNDCASTPLNVCDSAIDMSSWQASQDLRASYSSSKFDVLAGLSFGTDDYTQSFRVGFGGSPNTLTPSSGTFLRNMYDQRRTTYAAYVDGTYHFTDQLDFTLGVRDTEDQTSFGDLQTDLMSAMFGSVLGQTIPLQPTLRRSSNGPTGRAVLTYKFTPTILAYGSYSRGYRSGAFNGVEFFNPLEANYVQPETVNAEEFGIKATLWRRVTANLSFFNQDITNQQVQSEIQNPPCPTCNPPEPATQTAALTGLNGYSRGVDFDLNAVIADGLTVHGSLTLLNTRYAYGVNQQIDGTPVGGKRFPYAPDLAIRAGADWIMWRRGDQKITLSGDIDYTGQFFFEPTNGASEFGDGYILKQGQTPYTLVDMRLSYDIGRVRLAVWANNIFNQYYIDAAENSGASFGEDPTLTGDPRTFGGAITVKF